ncbi:MAG: DUF3822 family protein [Aureispira sp.]
MVELTHNIVEGDFNKNLTDTYNLSILLGVDRLSYLISDAQQQILVLRVYQLPKSVNLSALQQLLLEDALLRGPFKQHTIGIFSTRFSLVPTALFDEKKAKEYLQMMVALEEQDQMGQDKVAVLDAINLYACETTYLELLQTHFQGASTYHVSTGMIQNFVTNFDSNASQNIFLHIYGNNISLTVVDHGKLIFHNLFEFKASPDCLYYVLLVFKQLGLKPETHPLYITGELVVDSEIHQLLYKYIKTIHFVNRPNFYGFGEQLLDRFPKHFFFDLYSLKLCES